MSLIELVDPIAPYACWVVVIALGLYAVGVVEHPAAQYATVLAAVVAGSPPVLPRLVDAADACGLAVVALACVVARRRRELPVARVVRS